MSPGMEEPQSDNEMAFFENLYRDFDISFSRNKFQQSLTPESLEQIKQLQNDSIDLENSSLILKDILTIKTRYIFPYKIKSIDNKNAVILPDSMGIELNHEVMPTHTDPEYYNFTVKFK